MQTKSTKPKSERPTEGQKRSATATKKSRVASETALMQAATLATGLLAENGDLTPSEAAPTMIDTTEAVYTQDETAIAGPNAATIEGEAFIESESYSAVIPADESQEAVAMELVLTEAEPTADLPAPPVEESASDAALPTARAGLVQSPLAARMLAEAAERRTGKRGRASRAVDLSLGQEFAAADTLVKTLKAQLNAAKHRVQGSADPTVAAQITEIRSQVRASRGSKVEGVAPFDAAIGAAREALSAAKTAKREFLAHQGIGVPTATGGGLSLRQQLNALRSQIREGADAADSAELTQLRAAYRAAKTDRQTAREKALAPLPPLAEPGEAEAEVHAADSEPMDDAPTGENTDINVPNDNVPNDNVPNDNAAATDDINGEEVPGADNAAEVAA